MPISVDIPQIKCLRCGTEAQMQPQALASDGQGGWKPVNVMRPKDWVQGPAHIHEITVGLCPPCGILWNEANKDFLVMPPAKNAPPVEEPKTRILPAKCVKTNPVMVVRNVIDTNIPYASGNQPIVQRSAVHANPPPNNVSTLKIAPQTTPSHTITGKQAVAQPVVSNVSPLKVSIGEIMSRNAKVIPCVPKIEPVPFALQTKEGKVDAPSNVTKHSTAKPLDTNKKMERLIQPASASTLQHVKAPEIDPNARVVEAGSGASACPIPTGFGPRPVYTKGRAGM